MRLHEFLSHLSGVKASGGQYVAQCPAHEDKRASLSVCERDGKLLVHCHAGCSARQIVEAMGLSLRDLYAEPMERRRGR